MGAFGLLDKFEQRRPFTEHEAWLLFRIAAIAEAIGWTLLIIGICLKRFALHGNNIPVLIAGQFHGTIFLAYLVATVGLYPSLGWKRFRAIVALAAAVPPYGSLLFEQWESQRRLNNHYRLQMHLATYRTLLQTGSQV